MGILVPGLPEPRDARGKGPHSLSQRSNQRWASVMVGLWSKPAVAFADKRACSIRTRTFWSPRHASWASDPPTWLRRPRSANQRFSCTGKLAAYTSSSTCKSRPRAWPWEPMAAAISTRIPKPNGLSQNGYISWCSWWLRCWWWASSSSSSSSSSPSPSSSWVEIQRSPLQPTPRA